MEDEFTISAHVAELAASGIAVSARVAEGGEAKALNDLRAFLESMARKSRETGVGVYVKISCRLV